MTFLFRTILLATLLFGGHASFATPQSDARYIAERDADPASLRASRQFLKQAFVSVYLRPLAGFGTKLADETRARNLIPEEDIAPYLDLLLSRTVEAYLSAYTPEQLASMAALLRADEDATVQDILSAEYRRKYMSALADARAQAEPSGSNDPVIVGLEEIVLKVEAFNAAFDDNAGEALAQDLFTATVPFLAIVQYGHEIDAIKRELDNPVTIALIQADGIITFANPVQRQTLLRQLVDSEETAGIRFITPPARNTAAN